MQKKKVTMQLIADKAGVSKYVVSKTLNGKPGVSDATRKRIIFIAKQLGYLKTETSLEIDTIKAESSSDSFVLVVMPNHRHQNSESSYWSIIFNGVVDYLEECGIGVVVISSRNYSSGSVNTSNILGIITVGLVSTEMLLELNKHQVPLVMIDHHDSLIKADSIFMDNFEGLFKLTSYLLGLGHTKVIFVGDIYYASSFYDRWLGFRTAMEKTSPNFDPKMHLLNIPYSFNEIDHGIDQYLEQMEKVNKTPTAFVCANDEIGERVMNVVKGRGYKIPYDVSITGFDNLEKSMLLDPPLTSVQVMKETIGKRAVSKLLWRIKNTEYPSEKVSISTDLIIRASVTTPKKVNVEKAPI
ncbi:LacI family DNA-binding transcriptional regulator [Jeotgalibacillus terrae]|uniref:LacI family DNA-binding transcriptional regulator n=1 Tax=Jeotgalibacillus terrae TaxID=587735 RepID=A0ABW5ZLC4_9BACL|nr:LacI family DNA-binding transcriptional regulator [Jeotgalibacillus terrae]MBM7579649.1 LacI family transcriptional regulator [Jeotgalibacillus terrae]